MIPHRPAQFMLVPARRAQVLADMSRMMQDLRFHLFITAIRNPEFIARHGRDGGNPYDVALALTFERVLHLLEREGETHSQEHCGNSRRIKPMQSTTLNSKPAAPETAVEAHFAFGRAR